MPFSTSPKSSVFDCERRVELGQRAAERVKTGEPGVCMVSMSSSLAFSCLGCEEFCSVDILSLWRPVCRIGFFTYVNRNDRITSKVRRNTPVHSL